MNKWLTMCEKQYRREILRHAATVQDEKTLDWWVKLSRDWIAHYVEYTTRIMRMSPGDRELLADACVRIFSEHYMQILERLCLPGRSIA